MKIIFLFMVIFIFCIFMLELPVVIHETMETNNITVPGWEHYRSRNISDYIKPHENTTIMNANLACEYPLHVLIVVCSSSDHFDSRNAIRRTWAYQAYEKFNISIVFLTGISEDDQINMQMISESRQYQDVIVEDFIDTYNNLTIKTMMALKWMKMNCNSSVYFMKTDDDTYLNLANLVEFLDKTKILFFDNFLCGWLICEGEPVTDPLDKWYMPKYLYNEKYYPHYLRGFCYIMFVQTALTLYDAAFGVPIVHMEDVYLTGLCAKTADVRPTLHYMFTINQIRKGYCSDEDEYQIIHSHEVSSQNLYKIHEALKSCRPQSKLKFFDQILGDYRKDHNLKIQDLNEFRTC